MGRLSKTECTYLPTSSPASRIHKGPGKGPGQIRGTRGRADNHKNVNEPPARVLPSRASIRG